MRDLDQKIKSDLIRAADVLTALGNAAEQLLSCVRALNNNLRAERTRPSGADLIELVRCYQSVLGRREQLAETIVCIRTAQQAAAVRDEKLIDDAMERAGLSQILALEALKGEKK